MPCGSRHTLDILRRGLQPDQNNLLALGSPGLGILGGKDNLTAGSAGRSRPDRLPIGVGRLQRLCVKLRMEQSVQLLRLNA